MRYRPIVLSVLLACSAPAMAQFGISFNSPGVSIGINLPAYPTLQPVPGYPVYYAPGVNTNYFFYDGLYWVYANDNWYASSWYNGPWHAVDQFYVPNYILQVPVRYYRHAPAYFHGWRADAAPHWGEHWGNSWAQKRSGWDHVNRAAAPAAAPLPTYQRQYSGNRYPQAAQQATIHTNNYRYQPQETVAREHYQYQRQQVQAAPQPQRQQVAAQPQRQPEQHAQPHAQQQAHDQGKGHDQGHDQGKGHEKDKQER